MEGVYGRQWLSNMIYNEINFEIAKIASKSSSRPELRSVLFKKDRTVATDSIRLLEISVPKDKKASEFPLNGIPHLDETHDLQPFLASSKELKKIKISDCETVINKVGDRSISFKTAEGETADVISVPRIEGEFPDYEEIFPKKAPVFEISLNARYLEELLSVMGKIKVSGDVKLTFYGKKEPILIEAESQIQRGRALLMPLSE